LNTIFPLAKTSGFKPKIKILPPRIFDVQVNILDSRKLTKDTGWKPEISFENGVKQTWEWYLKK